MNELATNNNPIGQAAISEIYTLKHHTIKALLDNTHLWFNRGFAFITKYSDWINSFDSTKIFAKNSIKQK